MDCQQWDSARLAARQSEEGSVLALDEVIKYRIGMKPSRDCG